MCKYLRASSNGTSLASTLAMTSRASLSLAAFLSLAVAGCNSNSDAPSSTSNAAQAPAASGAATASNQVGQAASAPAREAARAFVRGVHVVPGGPAVKLQADGKAAGEVFSFGNAGQFVAIEPGKKVKITALAASGARLSGPMPVDLESGDDLTVVVNGVPGDVALLPFKGESGGPESGKSKISFAHAAKELGEIEVQIDGQKYRGDIDYGDDTDYKTLPPGQHLFTVSYTRPSQAAPAPTPTLVPGQISPQPTPFKPRESVTLQQPANLLAGKVYTLVVFYDASKNPKARLLEDRFADTLQNAPKAN